jgi:hypothetical protein
VLHCISISKHCCKFGRKTIPPWFVLAYSGYSPSASSDNWDRSESLRVEIQARDKRSNPLKALVPVRGDELPQEDWMSAKGWNVEGWQQRCETGLRELQSYY